MKIVWTGKESSGKSLQLSRKAEDIRQRNEKWIKMGCQPRTMVFNQPMANWFRERIELSGIKYLEVKDLSEFIYLDQADIFLDELIKYFPQRGSEALTPEQMHFLSQGAKSGIQIYSASQDFSQVHKQFRLLTNEVYVVTKMIGSRRPMKTAPPVKSIWGLCYMRQVAPSSFRGDSVSMETIGWPQPFFIERIDCARFDTEYKIPMSKLPVKKVRKQIIECDEDGYRTVKYV